MGTSLGLLPVDNLVWFGLLLAILFLPVNHLSAGFAWLTAGVLHSYVSVIPNALGDWLLSYTGVGWCVVQLHAIPLGAWFRLNNTLVMGSFAFGLMMLLPNWIAGWVFSKRANRARPHSIRDELAEVSMAYRKAAVSPLVGSPVARDPVPMAVTATPQVTEPENTEPENTEPVLEGVQPQADVTRDGWQESSQECSMHMVPSPLRIDRPHGDLVLNPVDSPESQDPFTIRETFIELVRLRVPQPHPTSPTNERIDAMLLESKTPSIPSHPNSLSQPAEGSEGGIGADSKTTRCSPAHQPLSGPKSSNSLRFLLRHLTTHRSEQDCKGREA